MMITSKCVGIVVTVVTVAWLHRCTELQSYENRRKALQSLCKNSCDCDHCKAGPDSSQIWERWPLSTPLLNLHICYIFASAKTKAEKYKEA